jgi:uncharacterized protein (DUF2141 family)
MRKSLFLLYIIIGWSCASQTTPTGGPKDEIPPKLINTNPKEGSINVRTNSIELDFNEAILLEKPKEQIIITPFEKDVEYTFRKNKVVLKFKNQLKDSTTYTFNFRESVKDLTEKNPAVDVTLAFSTGNYIDSLSISGVCYELLTGKYIPNVTVALQPATDTFNIFKHKTRIITKTDPETGKFKFTNLKPGKYQIYAFTDKNNNLLVESQSELYAYKKEFLNLTTDKDSIYLPLIKVDNRPIKLVNKRDVQNYYNLKFNKSFSEIKHITDAKNIFVNYTEKNTSLRIYNSGKEDSVLLRLIITDSVKQTLDTTFYAKFNHAYDSKRKEKFKSEFGKATYYSKGSNIYFNLTFNKPVKTINTDSLFIQYDSISRETINLKDIKIDTTLNTISITKELQQFKTVPQAISKNKSTDNKKKEEKPFLYIGKGSFISIDNDSITSKKTDLTILKEEDLAKIYIEPENENQIYQLLTTKGEVTKSTTGIKNKVFENTLPADYLLRVIQDLNNNGKWDPAIPEMQQEAEPIYYYFNDEGFPNFFVKANWDYGPLLIKPNLPVYKLGKEKKKPTNR